MPLYLERLNADVARGCQVPGCTHAHGFVPLHLAARCHGRSGVTVTERFDPEHGSLLHIACHTCGRFVCEVAIGERSGDLDSPCHPEIGVHVSYGFGEGMVKIACHRCDRHLGQATVRRTPSPALFRANPN